MIKKIWYILKAIFCVRTVCYILDESYKQQNKKTIFKFAAKAAFGRTIILEKSAEQILTEGKWFSYFSNENKQTILNAYVASHGINTWKIVKINHHQNCAVFTLVNFENGDSITSSAYELVSSCKNIIMKLAPNEILQVGFEAGETASALQQAQIEYAKHINENKVGNVISFENFVNTKAKIKACEV